MSTRFQTTERELSICATVLELDPILKCLNGDELRCAIKLIQKCRDIAEIYQGVELERLWSEHPPV